jgi:6-phosphofructokinase
MQEVPMSKKIGILTGGGDCPGLNAVIRGVVKSAIIRHGWEVIGIEDGLDGLLDLCKRRPLMLESVRGILPRGGSPTTFDRALGSRYGTKAVAMVAAGEFGRMVCLRGRSISTVSIEDATCGLNLIDPEGEIVRAAEDFGIMLGR